MANELLDSRGDLKPRLTAGGLRSGLALAIRAIKIVCSVSPRRAAILIIDQATVAAALAFQVFFIQKLLVALTEGHGTSMLNAHLAIPLALLGISAALIAGLRVYVHEQSMLLSEMLAQAFQHKIASSVSTRPLLDFEQPQFHDTLQRATIMGQSVPLEITTSAAGLLGAVFSTVTLAAFLGHIDLLLLPSILPVLLPSALSASRNARTFRSWFIALTETDRRRQYIYRLFTRRDAMLEMRIFRSARSLLNLHDQLGQSRIAELRGIVRQRARRSVAASVTSSVIALCVLAYVLSLAGRSITIAAAGAAIAALFQMRMQLEAAANTMGNLQQAAWFFADFELISRGEQEHGLVEPSELDELTTGIARLEHIAMQDVSFTYPGSSGPAIQSINLELHAGSVTAVVGENGCGKTTLARVLSLQYPVTSGKVIWNDGPISSDQLAAARSHVLMLPQDFMRYLLSVRLNVNPVVGRWNSDEEIRNALHRANATGFVDALPRGIETQLGKEFSEGVDISIGQWQRLAIARVLLPTAQLIILDEPTSFLDPVAEHELLNAIRECSTNAAVVLITHRMSSASMADDIVVMGSGIIVERGSHRELLESGGKYARMHAAQRGGLRISLN